MRIVYIPGVLDETQPMIRRAKDMPGFDAAKEDAPCKCGFKRGDKVIARPVSDRTYYEIGGGLQNEPENKGEVIAVHPDGLWVMVAFAIGNAWVRECFHPQAVRKAASE